jgi:hypothetical protein
MTVHRIDLVLLLFSKDLRFMIEKKFCPKEFKLIPGDEYTGGVDFED